MHPLQALTTASENRNSAIWKVRIKGVARVPQIFSPSCPQDSDYCDVCVEGGGESRVERVGVEEMEGRCHTFAPGS